MIDLEVKEIALPILQQITYKTLDLYKNSWKTRVYTGKNRCLHGYVF